MTYQPNPNKSCQKKAQKIVDKFVCYICSYLSPATEAYLRNRIAEELEKRDKAIDFLKREISDLGGFTGDSAEMEWAEMEIDIYDDNN